MHKDIMNSLPKTNKKRFPVAKMVAFIILVIVAVCWLLPLVWMIGTSVKTDAEIIGYPSHIFPTMGFDFSRYSSFVNNPFNNVYQWMLNSSIIAFFSIILSLAVQCLAAYGFVFLDFKGKKWLWALLIGSMTIPSIASFVASFSIQTAIGKAFDFSRWYIYLCLILPSCGGVFGLYLVRQFMLSIPSDIVESARIDGCSNKLIFRKIILPLIKSVLFVSGMFTFIGCWNSYQGPALLFGLTSGSDPNGNWVTVAVGLTNWATGAGTDASSSISTMSRLMAASTISTIPIMIVYCFCSNRIIDGIANTGVKR